MAKAATIADDLKDFATALLLRPTQSGATAPMLRAVEVLAREGNLAHGRALAALDTAAMEECPLGSERTYFQEASALAEELARNLDTDPALISRFANALAADPLGMPTDYDPPRIALKLLLLGQGLPLTAELRAFCAAKQLENTQAQLLHGALLALTSPRYAVNDRSKRANLLTAMADLDEELRFLLFALPPSARLSVREGIEICAEGESLEAHPLGLAMRAEVHAALSRDADRLGRHEHPATCVSGRFCPSPFEYAQVNPDGKVYGCCPAMLPSPLGDLRFMDLHEAWNSPVAQAVRASVLDGSFRHCDGARCGYIKDGVLPRVDTLEEEHRAFVRDKKTQLEGGPKIINMSYDRTCNLACPSCRPGSVALKGRSFRAAERIHKNLLRHGLAHARNLIVTGSGDPFASRLFLDFLRGFKPEENPGLRIHLSTNAVLLTPSMWKSIAHEAVDIIDVSIDAASPETYALNRGGNFARLLENLAFLGNLLRNGEIRTFNLHFVVQENNFHEMVDFVALGRRVGASRICFKELQDWGTYGPGEFARRAIHRLEHPRHEEFLSVLRDPGLNGVDVLLFDMGDLVTLHALG